MATSQDANAAQEPYRQAARRMNHLLELARGEFRKGVASTPNEVVWSKRKARLYHYFPRSEDVSEEPVLVVPWIGISRPYSLDLLPEISFIRSLCASGYHTYLLDWGEPGEEDADIGFEETSLDLLPRAVAAALRNSGSERLSMVGVCLGVPMALTYLTLTRNAPVRNFVAMVGPIDFDQGGMFKAWVGNPASPAEALARTWGGRTHQRHGAWIQAPEAHGRRIRLHESHVEPGQAGLEETLKTFNLPSRKQVWVWQSSSRA